MSQSSTQDSAVGAGDTEREAYPGPRVRVVAPMIALIVVALVIFGVCDAQGYLGEMNKLMVLRDLATAILVGGVIGLLYELLLQRQVIRVVTAVFRARFAPIEAGLRRHTGALQQIVAESHVMAVAQRLEIQDIFSDRTELFDRELRRRLANAGDISKLYLVGISLRDFMDHARPGGLFSLMIDLDIRAAEAARMPDSCVLDIRAVIMRGDCLDAHLRIAMEEGYSLAEENAGRLSDDDRKDSQLWRDYQVVVADWGNYFEKVELREFDHLPTSWIVLVESANPTRSAVYIEQYHCGRPGSGAQRYICLGGTYPVLKFGPGAVYKVLYNHVEALLKCSQAVKRPQRRRVTTTAEVA